MLSSLFLSTGLARASSISHALAIFHVLLSQQGNTPNLSQHRDTIYFVVSLFPLDFLSRTQSHMPFKTSHQLSGHSELCIFLSLAVLNL